MRPYPRRPESGKDILFNCEASQLSDVGIASNEDGTGKLALNQKRSVIIIGDDQDRGESNVWAAS